MTSKMMTASQPIVPAALQTSMLNIADPLSLLSFGRNCDVLEMGIPVEAVIVSSVTSPHGILLKAAMLSLFSWVSSNRLTTPVQSGSKQLSKRYCQCLIQVL